MAAKLAQMPDHRPKKGVKLHPSAEDAAALLNVSGRTVRTARAVQRDANPEIAKAVKIGVVAVSAAAVVAKLPEAEQREIAAAGPETINHKAKEIREAKIGKRND